jgi:hypothetical protein
MRDLETTAQTSRMLYESFLGRLNQTRYTQTVQQQSFPTTEARILTQATPPLTKTSPRISVVLVLGHAGRRLVGSSVARCSSTTAAASAKPWAVAVSPTTSRAVPSPAMTYGTVASIGSPTASRCSYGTCVT